MAKTLTDTALEAVKLLHKHYPQLRFFVLVSDGADVSAGTDLPNDTVFPLLRGYMELIERGYIARYDVKPGTPRD